MSAQKVSLAREDFPSSVSKSWQKLLKEEKFSDVTLVCEDSQQIKAHKVILSSSSVFFNNILTENHHEHPLIYLKGVKHKRLKHLIEFIYSGETCISESEVGDFVELGKDLKVEGLDDEQAEDIQEKESPLPMTPKQEIDSSLEEKVDEIVEFDFPSNLQEGTVAVQDRHQIDNEEDASLFSPNKDILEDGADKKEIKELMDLYKKKESGQQVQQVQNSNDVSVFSSDKCIVPDKQGRKRIKEIMVMYKKIKSEPTEGNPKDEPFSCMKCEYTSENQVSLKKHILSKHEEIRYQCDKCEKNYSDSSALLRHKKTVHEGVIHKCDVCDKQFSESGAVTRHKKNIHSSIN